jgi:hypothetical protein
MTGHLEADGQAIDVQIRSPGGDILNLPDEWATLLAENLIAYEATYSKEAAVSSARKIELRLTREDESPVDFDQDERIETLETLTAVCTGWHKSEGGEWTDSAAFAFYRAFEGRGTT